MVDCARQDFVASSKFACFPVQMSPVPLACSLDERAAYGGRAQQETATMKE